MNKVVCSILLGALSQALSSQMALAQNPLGVDSIPKPSRKWVGKAVPPQPIGKEPNVPGLPRFPGARFLSAKEPGKETSKSSSYRINYVIPLDSASQVIPFYTAAFNGGGWTVSQHSDHSLNLINQKTNTYCTIMVGAYNDYYAKIEVDYDVAD